MNRISRKESRTDEQDDGPEDEQRGVPLRLRIMPEPVEQAIARRANGGQWRAHAPSGSDSSRQAFSAAALPAFAARASFVPALLTVASATTRVDRRPA